MSMEIRIRIRSFHTTLCQHSNFTDFKTLALFPAAPHHTAVWCGWEGWINIMDDL